MSGFGTVSLILVGVLYFVPLLVAILRHSKVGPVLVIDLFFGWTIVGWIFALVLAVWPKEQSRYVMVPYSGEMYTKGRVTVPGNGSTVPKESDRIERSA